MDAKIVAVDYYVRKRMCKPCRKLKYVRIACLAFALFSRATLCQLDHRRQGSRQASSSPPPLDRLRSPHSLSVRSSTLGACAEIWLNRLVFGVEA